MRRSRGSGAHVGRTALGGRAGVGVTLSRMAGPARPLLPPAAPETERPPRFSWTTAGMLATVVVLTLYGWLWLVQGKPVGAGVVLIPLLLAITAPFLVRAARSTPEFDLGGLLLFALALRFGLAYYRFLHAQDAWGYYTNGVRLGGAYLRLDFGEPTGRPVPGTGGMRAVSGVIHIFVNNDYFGAFLVCTWLAFLGCWLMYRAFDLAVTDGSRYRYAVLVLLWPAMTFWPSSLGKDSWMVFTIGLAAYGAARVYQRLGAGYTFVALGLLGASFVRPHLALLALFAFVAAFLVGRRDGIRETFTPSFLAKLVGLAMVIVLGSVLISRTQRLLDIDDFTASSLETASAQVTLRTTEGGAAFDAPNPRSPVGFFEATTAVLFRPFPTEAHGTEQLLSSVEGLALLALTVLSLRRLLTVPGRLRAQPYVAFALAYVLLWILVFGVIGNFGILARQRTGMLPIYFVLLCVPATLATRRSGPAELRSRPATT